MDHGRPSPRQQLLAVLTALALFVGTAGTLLFAPTTSRAATACTTSTAVAHRGGSETYTENTLNAYMDAWEYGVRAWETDIRWDVTGRPVLMHDATIDRTTTSTGAVTGIKWSTSYIKLNDGQMLRYQNLHNLLNLARSRGATVAIEPKVTPTAAQAEAVVDLIDTFGLRDRVLLNSFSKANLAPFKKIAPDLEYSLVSTAAPSVTEAKAVGDTVNVNWKNLTPQLVDDYQAAGIRVYAWTLDSPADWLAARSLGADRIVTNRPGAYRGFRDYVCTGTRWY